MKHPDNQNHANGTCEACGGPCAVYGCRYCPTCYWPETLAEMQMIRRETQKDEETRNQLLQPVSQ